MRGEYRHLVINNSMIVIYSVLCAVTAYFNSIFFKKLFSKSVDTDVLYWQFYCWCWVPVFAKDQQVLCSKQLIKKFYVSFDPQFIGIVLKSISCVSPCQTWSYFGFSACTSTPTFIQEITDVRCQELETVTFEAVFAGTPMPGNPIIMNISMLP